MKSDVVALAHIENFALKVFSNADNEDRAGLATKYFLVFLA
jgi:vacuolar protein sorting-associated protein VTA1